MSAEPTSPDAPPGHDAGDDAGPGIPGLSRWSEVYALVLLHFVLWVFLLAKLTMRFA